MEIIGKTNDGFLCNLNREEVKFIVTGDWSGDLDVDKTLGKTIKLHELFSKCRTIEKFKTTREYQSVREQLEDLLAAFTKIESFVERRKTTKTTNK